MIHYEFPRIETIDHVLPHIENRPEFSVMSRDTHTVIAYNVQTPDTFRWMDSDPIGSAVRRECRGLIFENTGMRRIIRRPVHKFKNVNEDHHHQSEQIDLNLPHWVREKMDGSMIAPFVMPGTDRVVYGTKRGITDIGMDAERFAANNWPPEYHNWVREYLNNGYTPVFEWCSPDNRIVLDYDIPALTLLLVRDRITGSYLLDLDSLSWPGPVVDTYDSFDSVESIVNHCADLVDEEGYVLTFASGQMVKFKSSWYIGIHRVKELITSDRQVISLLYQNQLDDAISVLPDTERESVGERVERFMKSYHAACTVLERHMEVIRERYGSDRKRIAQEYMVNLDTVTVSMLFEAMGGCPVSDCLWRRIGKVSERSNKRFDEFVEWMNSLV